MSFYKLLESECRIYEFTYDKNQEKFDSYILSVREDLLKLFKIYRTDVDINFNKLKRQYISQSYDNFDRFGSSYANYPDGFCGQITNGVLTKFKKTELYNNLIDKGIIVKPIFGIEKELELQNAIQIGLFYINVSLRKKKFIFEKINDNLFKNITSYKQYFYALENYWNCEVLLNPVLELSFYCPFLLKYCDDVFYYSNIPKRLLLNSFLDDFNEIEEVLYNKKYLNRALSLNDKRQLNMQKKLLNNVEFLDFEDFLRKRDLLKKQRQGFGKEKYDELLFKKYYLK